MYETKNQLALIYDDNSHSRAALSRTLLNEGLAVLEASDGHQAIRLFFECAPNIIIINLHRTGDLGGHICEQIRASKAGQHIPIMMLTNDTDPERIQQYYRLGASDFMKHPVESQILLQRIHYMLRASDTLQGVQKSERQLRQQAETDSLTGLANRQSFTRELHQFLHVNRRRKNQCAVMMIDIDRFKRINDTLGHKFGDKLLQTLGKRLAMNLRTNDLLMRDNHQIAPIARLGGDEFIVVLNNITDPEIIDAVVKRHIETICLPVKIDDHEVVVTPSIGIALCPQDGEDVEILLKNAETAMYYAKESGGCNYKLYTDTLNPADMERLQLEKELRNAVKDNQLSLNYQPQVDTHTGEIVCLEALARWDNPLLGPVPPDKFIPVAEECGLIIEIGDWVLNTACHQAKQWLQQGLIFKRIAVNVSSYQFSQPDFSQKVVNALERHDLAPHFLELEMTESLIMATAEKNICLLKQLKQIGVSLAVDDFGTGYSSLSYLKRFPIDTLKIDRSFVTDMLAEEDNGAIVEVIVALAEKLKLNVVAEGVEELAQVIKLSNYQCALLQGYYFSKALPATKITELLQDPSRVIQTPGKQSRHLRELPSAVV